MSAKEILEAKWLTEDVNTVNYALEVGRHGNPSSELMQSSLLQVMGPRELDTTSLEGTLDQDREDSGENLNIAPTMVYLLSGVSICPENLIFGFPVFGQIVVPPIEIHNFFVEKIKYLLKTTI